MAKAGLWLTVANSRAPSLQPQCARQRDPRAVGIDVARRINDTRSMRECVGGCDRVGTQTRRRVLIAAAAVGATFLPLGGIAQQQQRIYRVGVLGPGRPSKAFVAELSQLGYREGVNLVFEIPLPSGSPRKSDFDRGAEQLVKANVDLIFARGNYAAVAAKRATSTIPIVFSGVSDPVAIGVVRSLSRPGTNLTGNSLQAVDTDAKEFQLFVAASGTLRNVACVSEGNPVSEADKARMIHTADAFGTRLQFITYESVQQLERMVERLAREGVDGIVVANSPSSDAYRRLAELLIKLRLPSVGSAADGYLLGYSYSSPELSRIAARQVVQILKGAKPGDLPVEQVSTFELEINLRTAKALGLSIPSSVLLQATRVIE